MAHDGVALRSPTLVTHATHQEHASHGGEAITRRALLAGLSGLLLAGTAAGAQTTGRAAAKNVFTHDLPDITLDGWAVSAVEVSYKPGEGSSAHRHPGITIAYVLEGAVESKVDDGPERRYAAGEMFIEMPGQLHAVSRNASATQPARLLAVLLAKKGVPLRNTN